MAGAPLCGHACGFVADLCAELARATGAPERTVRLARGLTPDRVEVVQQRVLPGLRLPDAEEDR